MNSSALEKKSLDELRALARVSGLRGYSGLRKKELIELLAKQKARPSAAAAAPRKTAKKPAPSRSTQTPAAKTPAVAEKSFAATEQRIESAKFEMTPPGTTLVSPAPTATDLHEDIERLPAAAEPLLCLLPQKPGVVHAYWVLQSGATLKPLRLRLCRVSGDAIELLDEVEIPGERGHWYFQLPASSEPGNLVAQLGSYDATGTFVTAIRRGIARIPDLYASEQTDRRWWIGEQQFRAMYMRAGGIKRGARLLWPGSFSSPGE